MISTQCFESGCELEVKYACQCLSYETYMCPLHLRKHFRLPNRKHSIRSIYFEPWELTIDTILALLSNKRLKKQKIKKKILDYLKNSAKSYGENLKKLDLDSSEVYSWIRKNSQTKRKSQFEKDSVLKALALQPEIATKTVKEMIPVNPELCSSMKRFCKLSDKIEKTDKRFTNDKFDTILDKRSFNIDNRLEEPNKIIDGNQIHLALEENKKNEAMQTQSHQNYVNQLLTPQNIKPAILNSPNKKEIDRGFRDNDLLYLIYKSHNKTNLFIYDIEREREEVKILDTPYLLDYKTSITQLPNGELFCFGCDEVSGLTLIIDRNYGVRVLPSGLPCYSSSAIYFNWKIYCFGGKNDRNLALARYFDLHSNRWINLAPMPKADEDCYSTIFNENILISRYSNRNLLIYSIDIDSFSTIPYDFAKYCKKILINAERLYLIECSSKGYMYETEIGDEYSWKPISKSVLSRVSFCQIYCSINGGEIYISTFDGFTSRVYYKFDLDRKVLIDISYYNEYVTLRRLGNDFKTVVCYDKDFNLKYDLSSVCANKRCSLCYLGDNLEEIERPNTWTELNIWNPPSYSKKGESLYNIERYHEAIECYDLEILRQPKDFETFFMKGEALDALKRYSEAIECYNESIKLNPNFSHCAYFNKGKDLKVLGKYFDALECYDKAIKINSRYLYFCFRGCLINDIGREKTAIDDFNNAYIWIIRKNRCHSLKEKDKICIKLILTLYKLQLNFVEFKQTLQYLKDVNLENKEFIKEIEKKEAMAKKKHSIIINRAADSLDKKKIMLKEVLQQIKKKLLSIKKKNLYPRASYLSKIKDYGINN